VKKVRRGIDMILRVARGGSGGVPFVKAIPSGPRS
jgi:hypothetical protein